MRGSPKPVTMYQEAPLNIAIWLLAFACAALIFCLLQRASAKDSAKGRALAVGRAARRNGQGSGETDAG